MALLRKAEAVAAFASPERAALAAEIERYTAREAERAKARVAEPRLAEAVWDARRRVEEATAGLVLAKSDAARHLRDQAQGTAGTPPVTVGDARRALQAAEDAHEAAIAALEGLHAAMADADQYPELAEGRLRNAALAVFRVEAADAARRLAAEVDRMQRELVRAGTALEWLAKAGAFPTQQEPGAGYDKILDPAIAITVGRIRSPSGSWNELLRNVALRGDGPWAAALAALMRDASAPLPE